MSKLQEQKQVTVEKLLELKRFERPTSEFWSRFENDLQVKRLQALVEKPSLMDRLRLALRYTMIWFVPVGGTAALAFALWVHSGELKWLQGSAGDSNLAVGTMSESGQLASQDPLLELTDAAVVREESASLSYEAGMQSAVVGSASPQFIMDALSSEDGQPTHFRRVMHSSDFSADRHSTSRYVADPIPASRGAVVHPAVFTSSSRNF